jgi:hypothetical protein
MSYYLFALCYKVCLRNGMLNSSIAERLTRRVRGGKDHTLIHVHNSNFSQGSETPLTGYLGQDYSHCNDGNGSQLWTPTVLRPLILVAFAVISIAILIVTEVLFAFSNRNKGISASDPKYRYLWTYGPTAGRKAFHK